MSQMSRSAHADDAALDDHQRAVLELHLHPERGSRYWRGRARALDIEAGSLERVSDLARFGQFDVELLRRRPLEDFIPVAVLEGDEEIVPVCTGGATAAPCWAAFTEHEFEAAFLAPFRAAVTWCGFPRRGRWLYVGPTGAHPIGRAAERCARSMSGHGAFTIDFDPRWARSLAPGSYARERYLAHVVAQAREILETQRPTVLFSTPPVLTALAAETTPAARERILGVHHGGTAAAPGELERLAREAFPGAVFMGGYGNSLAGMSPQLPAERDHPIAYATASGRLDFRIVGADAGEALARGESPRQVAEGERGRVLLSRFDRSFLILGHLERDDATRLPPSPVASASGLTGCVLGDPRHHEEVMRIGGEGLY